MVTIISLLRGVNVGGHGRIKMLELVEIYRSIGLENVRTYVQSGNVVFSYNGKSDTSITSLIEKGLTNRLGPEIKVFNRTRSELAKIVATNPFKDRDNTKLHITFLYSKPPANYQQDSVKAAAAKGEEFSIVKREAYLYLPNGYGRSKLSNNFFERKLGVPATTRNWNTVNALLEIARTK
jgi:uncharacterized protein (DUF1697 family)